MYTPVRRLFVVTYKFNFDRQINTNIFKHRHSLLINIIQCHYFRRISVRGAAQSEDINNRPQNVNLCRGMHDIKHHTVCQTYVRFSVGSIARR